MPRDPKLFKDVKPGEAFSCDYAQIFESGYQRPWLYVRIGDTEQAIFLPTGMPKTFPTDKRVNVTEIEIKEI